MTEASDVRYVTSSDGLHIASWTLGAGSSRPLVFISEGTGSIEFVATEPVALI